MRGAVALAAAVAAAVAGPAGAPSWAAAPGAAAHPTGAPAARTAAPAPAAVQDVLRAAVDQALAHNPRVLEARAAVEAQAGAWVELRGRVLPQLALEGSYRRSDLGAIPSFGGQRFQSAESWSAGVVVEQVLFAGAQAFATNRQQQALREAVAADLEATVAGVLFEVERQLYALMLAEAEVAAQTAGLSLAAAHVQDAERRRTVGVYGDFEVLRAQVALANQRPALVQVQHDRRLRRHELMLSLGPGAELPELPGDTPITTVVPAVPPTPPVTAAVQQALARRPELRAARQRRLASEAALRRVRGNYGPQLLADASYDWQNAPGASDQGSTIDGWHLGLSARWVLFDGLSTRGAARQAQAAIASAAVAAQDTEMAIALEVQRADADLDAAVALWAAAGDAVRQAELALDLAQRRVDAGTATQLDLLDAQTQLVAARTNAARAAYGVLVARARLALVTGASVRAVPGG